MKAAATLVAVCLAALGAGCAGPASTIVDDPFDISETTGAPEISAIVDAGGGDVTLAGPLAMEPSDGVAVIGETLWVRGRSFGRQPTVQVGGRPAAVLGRTRDGGLVVRVPAGTPSGAQAVVVSNEVGKSERPVNVRRYAAVLAPGSGQIGWSELGADGPVATGTTPVPGGRWLALSSDGRAGYVAEATGGSIDVVDLPAPGAPKVIYRLALRPGGGPVVALAAAARAPLLAVVRANDVVLVDTSSPLHPARSEPRAFPQAVRDAKVVAADISPDGKLLAVATEAGNQVVMLDLGPAGHTPVAGMLAVAPEIRESVLADVAFAPGGDTLWVLSGDTPRSAAVGPEPTELRAVRLRSDAQSMANLTAARVVEIAEAAAPVGLGVGRALPLASGAAIRLPPERNTVFFAATAHPGSSSGIFRVGAEDAATVTIASPSRLGRPDISPEGRWLLAPAAAPDGSVHVLAAAIDGRPAPPGAARPVAVIGAAAGELPPAARPAPELRIQP
ncbi:MAG TPA: IPT/TIG domain-containing protein [Polyangia bacterium]|nr:IPT/TIG domain-containing protein [Polyangia bacterium]